MSPADRSFRICLLVAFSIGGFFFKPLFLLAGFIAWTMLKGTGSPQPLKDDPRKSAVSRAGVPDAVSAATPDWKEQFMAQCDSPAETVFLEAIIQTCQLTPNSGALRGDGLNLRLQVQAWYYRLDFLVDDWLIVEIDGATYHSSQDAVRHDRIRDGFLDQRGYTTLRIPASVVFKTPDEAVRRVQHKLQAGNPKYKPHQSLWQEARGVIAASGDTLSGLSREMRVNAAVREGISSCAEAARTERTLLEAAVNTAERRLEVETFRARSPQLAHSFDETYAELAAACNGIAASDLSKSKDGLTAAVAATLPFPEGRSDTDPQINAQIEERRARIMEEREAFFRATRQKLAATPGLRTMMRQALKELGCLEYGAYIGVSTEAELPAHLAEWLAPTEAPALAEHELAKLAEVIAQLERYNASSRPSRNTISGDPADDS